MSFLEVRDLSAGYGPVRVLYDVSLSVEDGEIAAVLGANGAGKTTLLRAMSGLVDVDGSVMLDGRQIAGAKPDKVARLGVAHVPEGRGTFMDLTVKENLLLGGYLRRDTKGVQRDLEIVYDYFPRLQERAGQTAGQLSGGEQQMLAVGRALMLEPRVMLLDEPSLGLAPLVVKDLFEIIGRINTEHGTTIVIVEQNAALAFELASSAHVLETGRLVMSGTAEEVGADEGIRRAYLGY